MESHEYLGAVLNDDGRCVGAVIHNLRSGEIRAEKGDAVILATGGPGLVYGRSTNSMVCTGTAVTSAYLHVNNFKNYQEIKNIVNEINLPDKYTSENIGNFYKLIIGPIDNKTADKLLSTFISKGYKESKLILN